MRKSLFNIVIFAFHIITLILLAALCIHFEIITLDLIYFPKNLLLHFSKTIMLSILSGQS